MKSIGVVTVRRDAGLFLKNQLDNIFSNLVIVNLYILSEMKNKKTITEESLLLFAGQESLSQAYKKINFTCKSIVANRSVNYERLNDVIQLSPGEDVFLLNDFESSSIETIKYLNGIGINHLNYIPLYPGANPQIKAKILITVSEYKYIPKYVNRIIDIGIRTIDISSIIEISLYLGLSNTVVNEFTTKYIKNIILLSTELNKLNTYNKSMRNKLQTIICSVEEGIIAIDGNNTISVFNTAAEEIFECSKDSINGVCINEIVAKMPSRFSFLLNSIEDSGEIFEYNDKKLLITYSKIEHNNDITERVYIIKPISEIQKIEQQLRIRIARKRYVAQYTFDDILGNSEILKKKKELARKIAKFDSPVYIFGESGTGKELFAHAIHLYSKRSKGPFVAVNFAAMTESLLESELFGYADGAFTGAKKGGIPGLFEQAHGGTLFLDEVGDSPLNFQVKLLRVLQEKVIRRIGDDKVIPVDVRVIVATNKDISLLVANGTFREDLYYRINVLPLYLPPIRERKEDIFPLAQFFYNEITCNMTNMCKFEDFIQPIKEELLNYDFPGNTRQIRSLIEYCVCTSENGIADKQNLPLEIRNSSRRCNHKNLTFDPNNNFDVMVLNKIASRELMGLSSGRRSLSKDLDCSEDKIKKSLDRLKSENRIIIRSGRSGIMINNK